MVYLHSAQPFCALFAPKVVVFRTFGFMHKKASSKVSHFLSYCIKRKPVNATPEMIE